jgi:hypothetical protein
LKISPLFLIPGAIAAICVLIWGLRQNESIARASVMLAAPVGSYYSTMALLDCAPAWLLVPVSLLATVLSLWLMVIVPFVLLPLAVIIWQLYLTRSRDQSILSTGEMKPDVDVKETLASKSVILNHGIN